MAMMVNVPKSASIASAQGFASRGYAGGITVRKRQTSNIKALALYSPDNSFDESFLNNYLKINIEPRLSRIAGVGEVNVMGADYSLRIWLIRVRWQNTVGPDRYNDGSR